MMGKLYLIQGGNKTRMTQIPILKSEDSDFDAMALRMYDALKVKAPFEEFTMGMREEFEHDDVTGGDLGETAKIVLAHLGENENYYTKLKSVMDKRKNEQNSI